MIIMVNGPPNSGKDAVCEYLKTNGYIHKEMKQGLYRETCDHFGVSYEWFMSGYTRDRKETPEPELRGLTRRQAMIIVSEDIIKPTYGDGYFGKLVVEDMKEDHDFCFSDSGFVSEVDQIINKFGKDEVIFIRLYRDGSNFSNDSRRYIKFENLEGTYICGHETDVREHEDFFFPDKVNVSGYIVHNNGGIEELYSVITDIVRTHNGRKNEKQIVQKDNI